MPSPVPLQKEKMIPMPAVAAGLGTAAAYYTWPFLISLRMGHYIILGLLLVLVLIISFIRVLKNFPGEKRKALYKISVIAVAAALGFSMGIDARRSVKEAPDLGLEMKSIIAVSGTLKEDPRTLSGGSGFGFLDLSETSAQGGIRASAGGNVMVFFPAESIPRLKEFGRGSEIYVDGNFSQKENRLLFNASSVHIVKPAKDLEQKRTFIRMMLLEKFQSRQDKRYEGGGAPVWGPLASALLLGMRDDLDVDLSIGFKNSGCAHILALSGMHLAILSGILAFLIRKPLGLRKASVVGAAFIIAYVFIAGSQPSLVRSAIMYLIGTISLWGFLKGKPISLLCMAFVIQLVLQSYSGVTLSFILSYLALAGILTLGVSLRTLFRGRIPDFLSVSLSASLGAFIFTAPVVAFYFNSLKPIGILVGLFIAPLSALFMVLALIALAVSFLPLPLWSIMDFILTQVYRLFEFTVSLAGRVPGISVSNPLPVLIFSVLFWVLIIVIVKKDYAYRSSIASFD